MTKIEELKNKIKYSTNNKFYIFRKNIDILDFKKINIDNEYKHEPTLDLTIYTILFNDPLYVCVWYYSICRLLENTDILNVKKIILITTENCVDYLNEIIELFNIPTLFEIHVQDSNLSKCNFILNENFTTKSFILQDADIYPHKTHTLYSVINDFLIDDNNLDKLLMLNEKNDPDPMLYLLGRLIGENKITFSDFLKTREDIADFFDKLDIDFYNFNKSITKWYNSSLVGFRKDSPIVSDNKIMEEFARVKIYCDETLWLSSSIRNNIKPIILKDISGIPFSFFYDDLKDYESFILSIIFMPEIIDKYLSDYNKIIFNL